MKAVKKGEVYLPYDTGFVFAEVNGDRVYWDVKKADGSMKATNVDKKCIGNSVSTKAPGSEEREDITGEYKYPEGKSAFLSTHMFLSLYTSVPVCLPVRPSVRHSVSQSFHQSAGQAFGQSVSPSVRHSASPSVRPSASQPVSLSVCQCASVSVCQAGR